MITKFVLKNEAFKLTKNTDDTVFHKIENAAVAGQNDFAAFQLVYQANDLVAVSVTNQPHVCAYKATKTYRISAQVEGISTENIKLSHIGFNDDDDGVHKADIILSQPTVVSEFLEKKAIFIEIKIPKGTKKGIYNGKVNVFSHYIFDDEVWQNSYPFTIEVIDAEIVDSLKGDYYFGLWQHSSNIARKHEVELYSDKHFEILNAYAASMAELGQKVITCIVSDLPWVGQGCHNDIEKNDLYEYNMIKTVKKKGGKFIFDYTAIDRYINTFFKIGINAEIELIGLINIWREHDGGYGGVCKDFCEPIRIRYFDEETETYCYLKHVSDIENYIVSLEQHFVKNGLIDKVRVVADEPHILPMYLESLNNLKRLAPAFKYKTAICHVEFIDEMKDIVSDFIPSFQVVCDRHDEIKALKPKIKGNFLYYVCCGPAFPNTFICSPLLESRFIGIFAAFAGLDGFMRWNYTVWPDKPKERLCVKRGFWASGDTNFVYPGEQGEPLLSLRYKQLVRGGQDYNLIAKIRKTVKNAEEKLKPIFKTLIKNENLKDFNNDKIDRNTLYSGDFNEYQSFRKQLLTILAEDKKNV